MRKFKHSFLILVAGVLICGLAATSEAVPLLDEDFDDLTDWTISGAGITEIDPAGQLHQATDLQSEFAQIVQALIPGPGTGDYYFGIRVLFDALPTTNRGYQVLIGGTTNSLVAYFYNNSLRVYNGTNIITAFSKTWVANTWYVLEGNIHTSQTLGDFYLDGNTQALGVDVSSGVFVSPGAVILSANASMQNVGTEWHVDYFRILEGVQVIPEPVSMILLGSLATGLFGAAGIRKRFSRK